MQAVNPITPSNQAQQSTAAPSQKDQNSSNEGLNAVDFQNFLTLLTAQLKNQDPLDPSDSTEFVAQLAQFSSVEQLVNANTKLDSIASSIVGDGIDKYASWLGKQAEVTNMPAYFDGTPVDYRLQGNSNSSYAETIISDSQGREVSRFRSVNNGAVQSWDGLINGAPAPHGVYTIKAAYFDNDGGVLGEETASTFGGVREVRLNADGEPAIVLRGGIEVTPSQITGLGQRDSVTPGA